MAKAKAKEDETDVKKPKRDPWKVLVYPQLAEKSMNMVELENKLVFVVNKRATKEQIKQAVEDEFNVKVIKVNVEVTRKGEKKAYVKLHPDNSAADIASRMGML
jgi:large subunit ribosomal protein L23